MESFGKRLIGAALLDVDTYEEVEADTTATVQAMTVVILSSVAAGLATVRYGGAKGLLGMTLASLVAWLFWAALIYVVGTKLLPEPQTKSDLGELLRTIGFASTPGLLMVVGLLPLLGGLIGVVVWVWILLATVVAVRQALDYESTGRAVAVCAIGFVIYFLVQRLIAGLLGLGGIALLG